jgi:hypothetical protein
MYPPVFALLSADSAVAAHVDTRIYPHARAPQRATTPYITWHVMGGAAENTLSAVPDIDSVVVRVSVWSDDAQDIYAIGQAVRDCLELDAHMEDVPMTGRDAETLRAWLAMTFRFWTARFDATSSSS